MPDIAPARPLTSRQRKLAALYRGEGLPRMAGAPPRVAIVGAGLAGLSAAQLLAQAGCEPAVFEASDRIGGRVRTEVSGGRVWELGGEFIDSAHDDIHALAAAFGVPMLDTSPPQEDDLETAYFFGGQRYTSAQVAAAYAEVAPRIAADVATIRSRPSFRQPNAAEQRLDRLSIAEYLGGLKLDAWLQRLLEVSYSTVYGGDAGDQSALNLLTLIGTDTRRGFEVFGDSDERYKLRDGTASLVRKMAQAIEPRIFTRCRLVRLRRAANDWVLTIEGASAAVEVRADAVLLALPFTLLRQVDLGDLLPPVKRQAVHTLGYGTNSKLMLATHGRVWREQGFEGGAYTDTALQSAWDCSRRRAVGEAGVFTAYLGGREGLAVGEGDESAHARRYAQLADAVFPGLSQSWTGESRRVHWPSEPFALGSYTCYRPGQWTAFGGAEVTPLPGGLYFAGEHCATASQGYLNGAAETGRSAALAILRRLA